VVQLIAILGAILFVFVIISTDKESNSNSISDFPSKEKVEYFSSEDYEKKRVINFDIYKIKGDLLNIDRRSFREGLKKALEESLKFKVSYNPNVRMVVSINEDINKLKRFKSNQRHRRYYLIKKSVTITVEYALFKNSNTTYFIDKFKYKADIKAGSYTSFDDAIYKINKRLYWIVSKKVANSLIDNYKTILYRINKTR